MTASRAIVKKKIRQSWPDDVIDVMAIVDRNGDPSSTEKGRSRVQLAVLKLVNGSGEAIQDYGDLARQDYRDVLAPSEFPLELRARHFALPDLSPQQRRDLELIRKQDREQYLT